jgi:hypothetical protein
MTEPLIVSTSYYQRTNEGTKITGNLSVLAGADFNAVIMKVSNAAAPVKIFPENIAQRV